MNARLRLALFGLLLAVGLAAIVVAVVYILWFPAEAGPVLLGAAGVLVLALIGEIALLVLGRSKGFDEEGEWRDWQSESQARELLLRCTQCGNTFPVLDTGERPLRHACPHCGRVGILKDTPPDAPAAPGP